MRSGDRKCLLWEPDVFRASLAVFDLDDARTGIEQRAVVEPQQIARNSKACASSCSRTGKTTLPRSAKSSPILSARNGASSVPASSRINYRIFGATHTSAAPRSSSSAGARARSSAASSHCASSCAWLTRTGTESLPPSAASPAQ